MSAYLVALDGAHIDAVVVGGGGVAERKARALLEAGAQVRVIAPQPSSALDALAGPRLSIARRPFEDADVHGATLVIAATDRPEVNRRVAAVARAAGRLVNVASEPAAGTFVTVAMHRSGELVVGVTAGGVPGAAARVRDAIARRFDARYGRAVGALGALRRRLLDTGRRDDWNRAADALLGNGFCDAVESGALARELGAWR
mgnify:CR=1 FL=1